MRWPPWTRRDIDEELSAYADGALAGRPLRAIEQALETDPALRERLAQFQSLADAARADEPPTDDQDFAQYFAAISERVAHRRPVARTVAPWRWAVPAAAAALVVTVIGVQLVRGPDEEKHTARLESIAIAPEPAAGRQVVPRAPDPIEERVTEAAAETGTEEADVLIAAPTARAEAFFEAPLADAIAIDAPVTEPPEAAGAAVGRAPAVAQLAESVDFQIKASADRVLGIETTTGLGVSAVPAPDKPSLLSLAVVAAPTEEKTAALGTDDTTTHRARIVVGESVLRQLTLTSGAHVRFAHDGLDYDAELTQEGAARWHLKSSYGSEDDVQGTRERFFDVGPMPASSSELVEADPIHRYRLAHPHGLEPALFLEIISTDHGNDGAAEETHDEAQ